LTPIDGTDFGGQLTADPPTRSSTAARHRLGDSLGLGHLLPQAREPNAG